MSPRPTGLRPIGRPIGPSNQPSRAPRFDGTLNYRDMPPVAHRSDLACSPDDTAIFFPDGPTVTAYKKAKRICRPCPARDDCAAWALRTGQPDGVWGGLDPRERRKLQEKKDTPPRAS